MTKIILIFLAIWLVGTTLSILNIAFTYWLFNEFPFRENEWHYHKFRSVLADTLRNEYWEETSLVLSIIFGPLLVPITICVFIVNVFLAVGAAVADLIDK